MDILVMKNTANNIMYTAQKLHTYKHSMELYLMKLHLKSHYKAFYFRQYFHYLLQVIYQIICFCTCNLYNINILQHHIVYHIHIHNY